MIALSPLYGGTLKAVEYLLSGGNEEIFFADRLDMQPIFSNWTSFHWIMPNINNFE